MKRSFAFLVFDLFIISMAILSIVLYGDSNPAALICWIVSLCIMIPCAIVEVRDLFKGE